MNIVLIGYRGTGKSVVGEILANRLRMPLMGMDAKIAETAGKSIPQIVEKLGWNGFRDLESAVVQNLTGQDSLVIDTGGGVIERPENVEILKKNGRIFWLKATVATILARIEDDTQRPALVNGQTFTEEVALVLEARREKYAAAADVAIDTDALTPEQIADKIMNSL
jgi:shikimate kinase